MNAALMLHCADGAPVSTSFRKAAFGNDDPLAEAREIAWQGPGAMSAGRVTGNGIHSNRSRTVSAVGNVAVPSGWGGRLKGFAPELYGASRAGALIVFALP